MLGRPRLIRHLSACDLERSRKTPFVPGRAISERAWGWGLARVRLRIGSSRPILDGAAAGRYSSVLYVEYTVEQVRHMETVQIVLDKKLLHSTDEAARRTKRNRSAFVREALQEHLRRLEARTLEERDREGYARQPQTHDESHLWETEAAWPAE